MWKVIYHRWFQMHFKVQVGRYEALQQMPVPRLRRQSSHYLTSPLDQRCHMLSSSFHNVCPVCQITLGAGRHHRDWLMHLSLKIRQNRVIWKRVVFFRWAHSVWQHSCPISSKKNISLSCKLFTWKNSIRCAKLSHMRSGGKKKKSSLQTNTGNTEHGWLFVFAASLLS